MCGLIGFSGKKDNIFDPNKIKLLFLYNQSRGEDSLGYYSPKEKIVKEAGKVIDNIHNFNLYPSNLLIGHTRQATIGLKDKDNAHPFLYGNVVGAHNGKIENYLFLSNTERDNNEEVFKVDSQVIFYLFNKYKKAKDVIPKLEGIANILMSNTDNPEILYVYKHPDRPLFYGLAEEGMYISSIENSLLSINIPKENIFTFKDHNFYTIKNGEIVDVLEIKMKEKYDPLKDEVLKEYRELFIDGNILEIKPGTTGKTWDKGLTSYVELPKYAICNSTVSRSNDGIYKVNLVFHDESSNMLKYISDVDVKNLIPIPEVETYDIAELVHIGRNSYQISSNKLEIGEIFLIGNKNEKESTTYDKKIDCYLLDDVIDYINGKLTEKPKKFVLSKSSFVAVDNKYLDSVYSFFNKPKTEVIEIINNLINENFSTEFKRFRVKSYELGKLSDEKYVKTNVFFNKISNFNQNVFHCNLLVYDKINHKIYLTDETNNSSDKIKVIIITENEGFSTIKTIVPVENLITADEYVKNYWKEDLNKAWFKAKEFDKLQMLYESTLDKFKVDYLKPSENTRKLLFKKGDLVYCTLENVLFQVLEDVYPGQVFVDLFKYDPETKKFNENAKFYKNVTYLMNLEEYNRTYLMNHYDYPKDKEEIIEEIYYSYYQSKNKNLSCAYSNNSREEIFEGDDKEEYFEDEEDEDDLLYYEMIISNFYKNLAIIKNALTKEPEDIYNVVSDLDLYKTLENLSENFQSLILENIDISERDLTELIIKAYDEVDALFEK